MSEQRKNQTRQSSDQTCRTVSEWVAVDLCPPGKSQWTTYPNMTTAASAIGGATTHSQVSLAVRTSPTGHVFKKGPMKGWKLRRANFGSLSPSEVRLKKRLGSATKVKVEFRAPGGQWTSCDSVLEAHRVILEQHGVRIHSGSISRFVNQHPSGHVVQSKRNNGWSFRAG